MSLKEKIRRFTDLLALNQRARRTGLHIFLAFPPDEPIDHEKMITIAVSAMRKIGFHEQPYLVYLHFDAARSHMHIVTTNIRADGSKIHFWYKKHWLRQQVDRQLELEFGLSPFGAWQIAPQSGLPLAAPEKIQYGKRPTSHAIAQVLQHVLHQYHYRSFDQLNAILALYNLTAKRGLPGSRLDSFHGLLYQVTDSNGKGRGAPIRASAIPFKPTLSWLEQRFAGNQTLDPAILQRTRLALDTALRQMPIDASQFTNSLRRQQLALAPTFDKDRTLTALFFIDLSARIVLTPLDIGQQYDTHTLRQRLGFDPFPAPNLTRSPAERPALTPGIQQSRHREKHH